MATPYQGGAALGDILFGGRDRGNSDVFLKRLRENYSTQKAMDDASTAQIQRIARESQTAETVAKATGLPLGQAAMIANALQSQDSMNLNTAGVTPLQMQEYGLKNRAVDSLAPELGMGNAALAAIDGKPLKRNTIDSGYQIDEYVAGSPVIATAGENARIGELGERANLSRVKAAGGGFAPRSGGGGGGKGGSMSASDHKLNFSSLSKAFPGVKLTSQWRTPKRNAEVGGVPNSQHVIGTAGDFVVPAQHKPAFIEQASALGYEVIDEGDHVHVEEPGPGMGGAKPKPLGDAATKPDGKAPQGVDQGEYDKATKKKADALDAIRRGAPKDKVAARLKEQGYPKLAELVMGAR